MAKDVASGFPDPDDFSAAPASLPTGWTGMTPLVPTPADAPPQPFVLPPYIAQQQATLVATTQRLLTQDTSGTHNFATLAYGNTKKVAASDATADEKASAHYVCDGFQDQDEINNALLEGSVLLSSGTFVIDGSILMHSDRSLTGVADSTVIKVGTTAASAFSPITNADPSGGNMGLLIVALKIDLDDQEDADYGILLDKVTQTLIQGVHVTNGSNATGGGLRIADAASGGIRILGCLFDDLPDNPGILIDEGAADITVSGCTFNTCFAGITATNTNGVTIQGNTVADCGDGITFSRGSGCVIEGNIIRGGDAGGISVSSNVGNTTGAIIKSNVVEDNGEQGIIVADIANASAQHIIQGNIVRNNGTHGIWLNGGDYYLVSSNLIYSNSQTADATYDGIFLEGDTNLCNLFDNMIVRGAGASKQRYGINISAATCNDNFVTGNDYRDGGSTGGLNDAGTGTLTGPGNNGVHTHADGATGGQTAFASAFAASGRISLTPGDFWAVEGTPALTNYEGSAGSAEGFGGWAMDGASDESIRTSFRLPEDWASGFQVSLQFFLAVAAGASEDVRLIARAGFVASGDTIAAAGNDFAEGADTVSVSSGAQYQVYNFQTTITPTNPITAGDSVFLTIHRNGDVAADDYNSDIVIASVSVDYTRAVV